MAPVTTTVPATRPTAPDAAASGMINRLNGSRKVRIGDFDIQGS
jgi:hypothetical protein